MFLGWLRMRNIEEVFASLAGKRVSVQVPRFVSLGGLRTPQVPAWRVNRGQCLLTISFVDCRGFG